MIKREMIDDTVLLQHLNEAEKEALQFSLQIEKFKRGEYIFRPQDEAEYMYIVKSGAMKISMDLSDGREQILYIYRKEDFVGGLNLLTADKYIYNGIALTDTEVIKIGKKEYNEILIHDENFLREMLLQSFLRIRKSEELIDRLSVINGDMKVAKGLIDLVNMSGQKEPDGTFIISPHMNRTELGSYTGLARETVTRKLSYFEDMGYIELLPKGVIRILDMDALSDLTV
ncbi:MAG: Crp/Fnr family transcriptional regulator [Ezakiella sp.]|nr:Crp/Fnr family transcriptional regulator [Ezakiella sp.]MDD7471221.1 Crp/Fnr family transcriptional regulator [Bacillota bacterium]MDY3923358.1 Crp/Fnr family transcriptional regulator [Ezakiella sp.]